MILVKCRPLGKVFPSNKEDEIGFMICRYEALDDSILPKGTNTNIFSAKGPLLPYSQSSVCVLMGSDWNMENGYLTLDCIGYEEEIPITTKSLSQFLSTIQGCSVSAVKRIINYAGERQLLHVLDADHEIINKAITNKYVSDMICNGIELRLRKKEIYFYIASLLPPKADINIAVRAALQACSIEEIRTNPFHFVFESVIPYQIAKRIAKDNHVPYSCSEGLMAALFETLVQNEGRSISPLYDSLEPVGNTFMPRTLLLKKTADMFDSQVDRSALSDALDNLIKDGYCCCDKNEFIYCNDTFQAEHGIAEEIVRLLSAQVPKREYKLDIYGLENQKAMRLAPEQRNAVKVALRNSVTLLIGGPGTGKTTIEQFIIDVYRLYHNREVLLVAPTGKAARRMSESTGEAALTIHKALGISSDTELSKSNTRLAAGLIIIDEASMLDCRVTYALLRAIQTGAHVVFVGDTNQLPSVGVGNVLYELINSGVLPIAALETVYRQKAGSTIAVNCARIKRGITDLEYSSTFQFISVHSQHEAAKKALELYRNELETGLTTENVCLLSPFRRSTETGVNLLNEAIQKTLNTNNKTYLKYGNKEFFLGDKVMFMANRSEISNGDVGYIISMDIAKKTFVVDYGDSRVFSYQKSDLRYFDLAYGISIHKSQGAEFTTCIIIVMDEHRMMLNRNLIYTAISRAKNKVVLVGTKTALDAAISTEDVSRRQSRLGALICELKK